jgi:transposase, IS5 family
MMAIDLSGQDCVLKEAQVSIFVKAAHPLIRLGNVIPWALLMEMVVIDLKKTTKKGFWWMGRKIKVRIHLGAYLLQRIYNLTDRKIEYQLNDNAAFQMFCGLGIVDDFYAPDHTKIEEFRNRLSAETQRALANSIAQVAVEFGFGNPEHVDFDSTVQEANISYPSDACLMDKLAGIGHKFIQFVGKNLNPFLPNGLSFDMKMIKKKAREYFFLPKNKSIEVKREMFRQLHRLVKQQMKPIVELSKRLTKRQVLDLPWNIRRACNQLKNDAWRYLLDVGHFTRAHTIKTGKILSFHAKSVACIKKGKIGKKFEFGRVFQLGRIKGNFLFVLQSSSIEMNDKTCFPKLLMEHASLFGKGVLKTAATDKGYWSSNNQKKLIQLGISVDGLQRPSTVSVLNEDIEAQERLRNRRAGIEPLIGRAKLGGQLGKSRMKSDTATLAAGYGSILGFNLRQIVRYQEGKIKLLA